MKISYILQTKDFFILLSFGILIGLVYELFNITNKIRKNLIIQVIFDLIWTIFSTILFIILVNKINMGQVRLFLFIGYLLGFIIERITLGKLFAKGFTLVYTKLIKFSKYISNSKFGKVIFK